MKNQIQLLIIAGLVAATLVPTGCSQPASKNSTEPATRQSEPVARQKTVAIVTLMTHPALDALEKGMREELTKLGHTDGGNLRYITRNANGQPQLAAGIAREVASLKPDVVVAITTPMAQAVAKTPLRPLVFAAVTDPVGAKLLPSLETPKADITGTSDAWPYEAQLKLIKKITPSVKRLGVLFNPGEAASQYGMKHIRRLAPGFGFSLVEGSVDTTADVHRVAQSLSDRVDALFLSSDNTVIGGAAGAAKVAFASKIPLYVGDSGTVEKGGLATVSVGYEGLGHDTGKLVDKVLKGQRNIPLIVSSGNEVYINTAAAARMGVSIPRPVLDSAKKVYTTIK